MDAETPHSQDNDFPQSPWVDLSGFHPSQQSPPMDYHGFEYGVLPIDPSYGVTIPPPYTSMPLTLPSSTWPSMLATTQPPFPPEAQLVPIPIAPSVSPITPIPPPRKSSASSSTPRRTLTDEDRRPLFGVERSTVSKVLRQKEKYLNPDDGSRSPIKRAKGRVPDIEKALSNWVRNYQRHGHPLTDEMIREKALFFASTCGSPDGKEKVLSNSWLEKFKQKNGLLGSKSRKGSFSAKSDSESPTGLTINPALASALHSPTILSPTSPTGFITPSPLSPAQSQENIRASIIHALPDLSIDYQNTHSRSTTSLDTALSMSAGVTSPLTESPFTPTSQSRNSSTDGNSSRPRSQTFPLASADPSLISTDEPSDQMSVKDSIRAFSMGMDGEEHDLKGGLNIDTSAGTIKRNRSNPEIRAKTVYPPSFSKSTTVSPISSPGSPTQDEARKALELVMSYFEQQPSGLVAQDYVTIGKLMERLELAKAQQPNTLPGGLTRIDEHDDAVPLIAKKQSIHGLG
ncbi:hypothetical protein ARAM_004164 [Aspergillus rambellii]|uniref:HTH CENPB-type domain-containing protein n=1 Tax=Aspergillus rambellii TaxID=308745 RepID=A0A0F8V3U0_9EURO|nr:hypothetical protein ARAM_004164 [Aspergillus rambellii]